MRISLNVGSDALSLLLGISVPVATVEQLGDHIRDAYIAQGYLGAHGSYFLPPLEVTRPAVVVNGEERLLAAAYLTLGAQHPLPALALDLDPGWLPPTDRCCEIGGLVVTADRHRARVALSLVGGIWMAALNDGFTDYFTIIMDERLQRLLLARLGPIFKRVGPWQRSTHYHDTVAPFLGPIHDAMAIYGRHDPKGLAYVLSQSAEASFGMGT